MSWSAPFSLGKRDRQETLRRAQRASYAVTLVTLVLFASTTVHRSDTGLRASVDFYVYVLLGLAALTTCALRAARDRRMRGTWIALTVGLASTSCGDLWWAAFYTDDPDPPFPSVADALWLGVYPALYVALLLLLRTTTVRFHVSMLLDAFIGGLGVGALALTFAYEKLLAISEGELPAVLTGLAYPAADLVMLVIAFGVLAMVGLRAGRVLWLIMIALLLFVTADTVYALTVTAGTYVDGGPVDNLWALATALFATAAMSRQNDTERRVTARTWWTVGVVPAVFALTSLLLLAGNGQVIAVPRFAALLSLGTLLLVFVRGALTLREVAQLADARQEARTDELTGLANRRGFNLELDRALDPDDGTVAVLLIDLDRFKEVNDALGHHVGDQLLQLVGPRIIGCLREEDLLARLGGDEFAILLAAPVDRERAEQVARCIAEALEDAFHLEGISLHVGASAGVALSMGDTHDATLLLQQADVAMYEAKRARISHAFYDAGRDVHSRDRLETIEQLHVAIERHEFVLHYQPKVALRSGEVIGVEALVRWQHPQRGLLYPDGFLPLIEQTGLMRPLTTMVLDLALGQVRAWRDQGRDLTVAVNISASNLLDTAFPDLLRERLARNGVPPSALVLELTETTLMTDPHRGPRAVATLKDMGIVVSIDDYGTGYSSLAYLRDLAVGELKLAREFVSIVTEDDRAESIVRTTVDLAHSLGLSLVAEGIEDADTAEILTALGCDVAQGFHFCRPCSPQQLERWLEEGCPVDGPLLPVTALA